MEQENTAEQERLLNLLQGYIHQTLSDAETRELKVWAELSAENLQLLTDMGSAEYWEKAIEKQQSYDLENALQRVKISIKPTDRKSHLYKYLAIAASLILIGFAIFRFYSADSDHVTPTVAHLETIKPGGNKAYLVLANGKKISLTDAVNGTLAKESGVEISKTADGQVVYAVGEITSELGMSNSNATTKGVRREKPAAMMNTIETPKGGQYQVRLPDGSKVWLNAASSLRFPSSFSGADIRKVELKGEAYFEVEKVMAKDKGAKGKEYRMPFIVVTDNQKVEVLGTHFNINSYSDEKNTKTTLIEGRVRVSSSGQASSENDEAAILKPGQQALVKNGSIRVVAVDAEEEVAWKNGSFSFDGQDFDAVMRMISRWYDVDVIYDYNPKNLHIAGVVSKYRDVTEVLKMLEVTGDVKFKVEGRRITVIR